MKTEHEVGLLNPVVKLAFNPEESTEKWIKRIFKSPVAMALWIAVRRDHLVSQHFNEDVWIVSRSIQADKKLTVERLKEWLRTARDPALRYPWQVSLVRGHDPSEHQVRELAERESKLADLLEYIRGNKKFHIEIKP